MLSYERAKLRVLTDVLYPSEGGFVMENVCPHVGTLENHVFSTPSAHEYLPKTSTIDHYRGALHTSGTAQPTAECNLKGWDM